MTLMLRTIIKTAIIFILVIAILFIGFLLTLTVLNKNYPDQSKLELSNNQKTLLAHSKPFTITTFNMGYAGLDEGEDFFADGGYNSSCRSKEQVLINLENITNTLKDLDSDFLFIQEIDRRAKRSHDVEQYESLKKDLSQYGSSFAYNYTAIWVPIPLTHPMGYAEAGMSIFSKYNTSESTRHQLQGQESWPIKLFELDRCFIENRVPLDNGKELILINLHLSAYDKGGKLRAKQAEHLVQYMKDNYKEGNYIVLGGDWNQLLSKEQLNNPDFMAKWPSWLVKAPDELVQSGFQWGIDESVMSVRDLATTYQKGQTFETIIDGFLVSPNLEILEVKGHDLGFKHSDHNPVSCKLQFKE